MPSPRNADAPLRAPTTDLDRPGASYDFVSLFQDLPSPPVLHLVRAPGQASLNLPNSNVLKAIVEARASGDLDLNADSAWMDPSEWLGHSLPRGLPWTDYPVVGNPRHRPLRTMSIPSVSFDRTGRSWAGHAFMLSELARQARTLVIHPPANLGSYDFEMRGESLRWVSLALEVADAMGSATCLMVERDGSLSPDLGWLRSLAAGHSAWLRFHYSYAANFYAIAAKALERSLEVVDPGTHALLNHLSTGSYTPDRSTLATARLVRSRIGLEHLSDPLALQVLYDLRRKGGAPFDHDAWRTGWSRALFAGEELDKPLWVGTSRHPPRTIRPKVAESVGSALARNHMLCIDGGRLVVSRTGEAFLDMLHKDCEDPDMPLRWARHPLTADDGAAMDAWIGRTFRKMKTRVNELAPE